MRNFKLVMPLLILISATVFIECSGGRKFIPPSPLPNDRQHIPEPNRREYNLVFDHIDKQFTTQLDQSFDISRQFRNLSGKSKQALNVNAFDKVANSSWFTNRNAMEKMSLAEIAKGPNTVDGPDTTGKWILTRAKSEGVTPGFQIKDKRGNRYMIKFDPFGYLELATGAETVSTKLFYAAGYFVPENYIVYFHPSILELGDRVKFTDAKGKKRYMNQNDLDELLNRIEQLPDGRIRATASKYLSGKPIGPFAYQGFRKDDLNDFIPHQHRRELRGLKVMAAWLNHTDTKSGNTLDTYISNNGKSFVRHHLIDFGSTLGSAARGPKTPPTGYINQIDPHEIILRTFTFGLLIRPYEKVDTIKYPSIGLFQSDVFDPASFKPNVPNRAFENCTNLDGFWGAKLVMSFTDEQLECAVAQGQYSNPKTAAYLLKVLKERRDKIGKYWFNKVNPLDKFDLRNVRDGYQQLCFIDLAVKAGLELSQTTKYRYNLKSGGKLVIKEREIGNNTSILLPSKSEQRKLLRAVSGSASNDLLWEIKIQTYRKSNKKWSKWVKVYLDLDITSGEFSLLGIVRQE